MTPEGTGVAQGGTGMTQGGTGVTQGECEVAFSRALAICSRRLALVLSLSPPLPVTSAVPLPVLPASHLLSFPRPAPCHSRSF